MLETTEESTTMTLYEFYMSSCTFLVREGTNNRYKVVFHGDHWSDIENVDDPTDTDYVKLCGSGYVSANKGHSYKIEEKKE